MDDGRGAEITVDESVASDYAGHIGPLLSKRVGRKSSRFNLPHADSSAPLDTAYVEITVDVRDDSLTVHGVKPAEFARTLERRSSFMQTASFRIRQVSRELRRLVSLSPCPPRPGRSDSGAGQALEGLKFISKTDGAAGWISVEKRFDDLAVDGVLPRSLFEQCIGMKESKDFAVELFDALSRRRNIAANSITKSELRDFWDQISDQSFDSRLQTFFDMVDKNADGRITEEEVREIISLSASANKLSKIQEQAGEYARLIMEELDPDSIGYIEIDNLETLLLQAPIRQPVRGGTNSTDSRNLSRLLSEKLRPTLEPNPLRRWYRRGCYFLEDNWKRVWVLALWLSVCAGLFAWKFVQYRRRAVYHVMGYCVCVAKGGAETLKFNMALILLPVCRNTITWLRNETRLGAAVPFDDNLNFHKVIAVGIAVGVGLHAVSHLTCDFPRLLHASDAGYDPMKPFFGDRRPDDYWWFVKGTEGWTGVVMVVLMGVAFTLASAWFRRGRGFNAFWYSHHLLVVVYILLIIHGTFLYLTKEWYRRTTWMYLSIPMILYGCERLTRMLRSSVRPVRILKVAPHPGNVLALQMSKPQGFQYRSGQYMFVNCAAVSPFEWHPFSITSAPQDDYLSVHIRTKGDWTSQLRAVFSSEVLASGKTEMPGADCNYAGNSSGPSFPRVMVDGPYGAPAQDYQKYEVVLLVGLGIGATPFISIIKDIVNNLRLLPEEEPCIEGSHRRPSSFKTRRAYFYWVTREQGSFEWFRGVMDEVAESDMEGEAIELHNYCTSVYEEGDARSALIAMIQSLNHAKHGVDVVTGTRVKSHFARPNWRNVYKRIALNHLDQRVGVFYCGEATLTKQLRQLARDFSRRTSTKFDFHKENF